MRVAILRHCSGLLEARSTKFQPDASGFPVVRFGYLSVRLGRDDGNGSCRRMKPRILPPSCSSSAITREASAPVNRGTGVAASSMLPRRFQNRVFTRSHRMAPAVHGSAPPGSRTNNPQGSMVSRNPALSITPNAPCGPPPSHPYPVTSGGML